MTPTPHWLTFVTVGLALLNIVQGLVLTFRREGKDERKALVARVDAAERKLENHDLRLQGIVQQHERECDNTERRFDEIMAELGKLPALYTTVATVANDVKHMSGGISDIKATLNQLSKS